jgi:CRP-like cAMP-binding protein
MHACLLSRPAALTHIHTSASAPFPPPPLSYPSTSYSNFLFSHLTPDERQAVFAAMERITVSPGDIIIRQGDRGDHFYVVESGTFCVLVATAASHAHSLQVGWWRVDCTKMYQ